MFKLLRNILLLALLASCTRGPGDEPPDLGLRFDLGAPADLGGACPPAFVWDLGVPTDSGLLLVVGASPDGTGYCCEPLRRESCSGMYVGGFAPQPEACLAATLDIAWTCSTREFIDDHGCVTLDRTTARSCNLPPPPR